MTTTKKMQRRARARRQHEKRFKKYSSNINRDFQRDLERLATVMGMDIGQKKGDEAK